MNPILKLLGMDNGEEKIKAGLNNSSYSVADPTLPPTSPISSIGNPLTQIRQGISSLPQNLGIAPDLLPSLQATSVDAGKDLWNSKLNLLKQVQAIAGLSPAQKQSYRNTVDETVPTFKLPKGVDKMPMVQNLENYGPYNSLINPNAIPNAVASAAKLPAYMGKGQTAKDLLSILSGATQGAGLLDLGGAGISALTDPESAQEVAGGTMHTPNIQQEVNDAPVSIEEGGQISREADFQPGITPAVNQVDPSSFNRSIDSMTAAPIDGQPLTPSAGYSNLQTQITPVSQQINVGGGVSAPSQADPQASAYENALNTKNVPLLNQLMSLHPGDARFAVHKMLGW